MSTPVPCTCVGIAREASVCSRNRGADQCRLRVPVLRMLLTKSCYPLSGMVFRIHLNAPSASRARLPVLAQHGPRPGHAMLPPEASRRRILMRSTAYPSSQQKPRSVHQCNCVTSSAQGLAFHMFAKFPYANTYNGRNRSAPSEAGTTHVAASRSAVAANTPAFVAKLAWGGCSHRPSLAAPHLVPHSSQFNFAGVIPTTSL